ncbi:MAG TPA: EAL domain-containing protein [Plasticicumulans sp.]|nr:EAL domain-containing protein [Plasticicumulans sp.]
MQESEDDPKAGADDPAAHVERDAERDETEDGADSGPRPPLIVGIAASAGGLEALGGLLRPLPATGRLAYVVVQHLSPSHPSLLVQLLQRECALRVVDVSDGQEIVADTVYVTPPRTNVSIHDGRLVLTEASDPGVPKPSADHFLHALAEDQGENAIAVILSGTGTGGAEGVRAVKAAGGFTFAQDDASAKYSGMPAAAIATGCVDLVLPPERIAEELMRLAQLGVQGGLPVGSPHVPASVFERMLRLVQRHTGTDFLNYKPNTLRRRVARRMLATHTATLEDYEMLLATQSGEIERLYQDILISVTAFFRDVPAFEALAGVLREMVAEKSPDDDLRVWVPGCATGEEAYTIAILLAEALGTRLGERKVHIFATDLDTNALAIARRGVYHHSVASVVPPPLLERYFTTAGESYQVGKLLRDLVIFARHDLAQDPPFLRLDLISCRNLLIYFKSPLQERVLDMFHYALRPGGWLLLGKSENPHTADLFAPSAGKVKLFRRRDAARARSLQMPRVPVRENDRATRPPARAGMTLEERVRLVALAAYAPAGIVVDEAMEVRYTLGDVSPYIRLAEGKANLSITTLIRRELHVDLRGLILKCRSSNALTTSRRITMDGGPAVRLAVHPLAGDFPEDPLFLVCFEHPRAEIETGRAGAESEQMQRTLELEQELAASREHLQTVIEELETSNEELQSLNEEMLSANEELQSTNEELETANEELQSTNEELITVNEELQSRSAQLMAANADLENLKNTLPCPVLVVDARLRLMFANPAADRLFGLDPDDSVGPLHALRANLDFSGLREVVERVIDAGNEMTHQFAGDRDHLLRARPYRDAQGRIRGAVLVFWDNTDIRRAEERIREQVRQMALQSRALAAADNGIVICDARAPDRPISYVNAGFTRITGYSAEEVMGRNCRFLQGRETDRGIITEIARALADQRQISVLLRNYRKDGEPFWNELNISPMRDEDGVCTHFIGVQNDVTERVQAAERARLALAVFENTSEGIMITDAHLHLVAVNPAFTAITGYRSEDAIGQRPTLIASGRHGQDFYRQMWRELQAHGEWHGELWNRRRSGEVYPELLHIHVVQDDAGHVTHYVGIFSDITELKAAERRMHEIAYFDSLTGLPNRSLFSDRLARALLRSRRDNTRCAVLFLDVDRFKNVNDTWGHETGDKLLQEIGTRISGCIRGSDTLARYGGDEFVLLAEDVGDGRRLSELAERIHDALTGPVSIDGQTIDTGVSIGIAICPQDGTEAEVLLASADAAMYQAKHAGRHTHRFHDPQMNALWIERMALEHELRAALGGSGLELHFLPLVRLADRSIVGCEALLRWHHGQRGLLAPAEFLVSVADVKLLGDIDRWVLRSAAAQHHAWAGTPAGALPMAVNLSGALLRDGERLPGLLAEIAGSWLSFEFTETTLTEQGAPSPQLWAALHAAGLRLVLDDFGTGRASLVQLRTLPLAVLKLHRSVYLDAGGERIDPAIVEAFVALARALGLELVAEGVETEAEAVLLRDHGCPLAQGWLFGQPLSAGELPGRLGAAPPAAG